MTQIFIFASDAHGTGKEWIDKIKQAMKKYPKAQLVLGGDYIDGRKFSKETLNFVFEEYLKGAYVLKGNHEDMLYNFVKFNDLLWIINGYKTTIKSLCGRGYGKLVSRAVLSQYKLQYKDKSMYLTKFIESLSPMKIYPNIIFVHAGVDPSLPVHPEHTNSKFALWAREDYYWQNNSTIFTHNKTGKTIVSGHTPTIFIYGKYENNVVPEIPEENTDNCPVKVVQYPNEKAKIFTDNGCHGQLPTHTGNIVVLDDMGKIVEIIA